MYAKGVNLKGYAYITYIRQSLDSLTKENVHNRRVPSYRQHDL